MRTIGRVLRRLRIENLVLIREAELELAPGLNAITGETGAGKTILAQAVGLLLGPLGGPRGRGRRRRAADRDVGAVRAAPSRARVLPTGRARPLLRRRAGEA